jgi:hypothetical protein
VIDQPFVGVNDFVVEAGAKSAAGKAHSDGRADTGAIARQLFEPVVASGREQGLETPDIRRLGAVLRKTIFDIYAAMPSSWNTRSAS